MASQWANFRSQLGGAAAFIHLWKHAKETAKQQGQTLEKFDPFQSRIDDILKNKVEELFKNFIEDNSYYIRAKQTCCLRLFPNTQSVLDITKKLGKIAHNYESKIYHFTHLNGVLRTGIILSVTILAGAILTSITLNPVKIVMTSGLYYSIIHNHSAFTDLLKDFQKCAELGHRLLKKPLEARKGIQTLGEKVVNAAYPNAEIEKDPHAYHMKAGICLIAENAIGSRETFEEFVEETIETHACRPMRVFEKEQRYRFFSRIADSALKKLTALVSSQAFRMLITNLTGLGVVALFYCGSHYFIDLPRDNCEWVTPLEYSWNRVFPFNQIYKFTEQCDRYTYLIWASDITKWCLRFYMWNKMVRVWQDCRGNAVDDLLKPVNDWSKRKWENITTTFMDTSQSISEAFSSMFKSLKQEEHSPLSSSMGFQHLPPSYTFDVREVRKIQVPD